MRSFASICLALLLAVTFGWAPRAHAAAEPAAAASHCADMAMPGDPAPAKAPAKAPDSGCVQSCAVGCVVPPELAGARIGERMDWALAFGLPVASLEPASFAPEAEDPPPRTVLP